MTRHWIAVAAVTIASFPIHVHAQDAGPLNRDSLTGTFRGQARVRFMQAGVETTNESWRLLSNRIDRGVGRLYEDGLAVPRIARARGSLNEFVDLMIAGADVRDGGKVAGEGSFGFAMSKCSPPKYPWCP